MMLIHCPPERNSIDRQFKYYMQSQFFSIFFTSIDAALIFAKFFEKNKFTASFMAWWLALFFVFSSAFTKSGIIETEKLVCFEATFASDSPSKSLNSSMAKSLTQYECDFEKASSLNSSKTSRFFSVCFSGKQGAVPVSNTFKSG